MHVHMNLLNSMATKTIPQMSPMNWFMLFVYFNICFFICMNKIYYLSQMSITKSGIGIKSCDLYNFNI